MKTFLGTICLALGMATTALAAEGDTTIVQVHNAVDMTWYGNYDQVGVFPNDAQKTYRKIWMHYTMGCASGGCSDWDYTTQIQLMQPINDTTNIPLELGRVITPYGGNLVNSWTRNFVFDVTDFADLLQDSVLIRAFYSGWSSGFSVSLRFVFIEGTPPRDILGVYPIYKGDGTYNNSNDFEANFFNSKSIDLPSGFAGGRIFSTITGHGFDNNVNCAEFCERSYTVKVNGSSAGTKTIWRDDCGSNPLFPQAGTWLFDRAGWCPGERAITDEWEVGSLLEIGVNNIDFDMQNYTWSGTQAPSYTVDARLVAYGSPNFNNDAYLLDVIAPNNDFQYNRLNPICGRPLVKVQNTGANPLTSITFQYRVDGAEECEYTWTGNLAFLDIAQIELPNLQWENARTTNPRFYAEIIGVNGANDEYGFNNTASTGFNFPAIHNFDTMYVELKTNNRGTETGYQVLDGDGNIVFQRVASSLSANTTYLDKIYFPTGCYTLKVQDSGKDGLSFWADAAAGSGDVQLKRLNAQLGIYLPLRDFGSDFGTSLHYPFIVGAAKENINDNITSGCTLSPVAAAATTEYASSVFPNPNTGDFYWSVEFAQPQSLQCHIYNALGQCIAVRSFENVLNERLTISLGDVPNGIYFLQAQSGAQRWTHTISVVK